MKYDKILAIHDLSITKNKMKIYIFSNLNTKIKKKTKIRKEKKNTNFFVFFLPFSFSPFPSFPFLFFSFLFFSFFLGRLLLKYQLFFFFFSPKNANRFSSFLWPFIAKMKSDEHGCQQVGNMVSYKGMSAGVTRCWERVKWRVGKDEMHKAWAASMG